jgi:3-hydroxybutyrate dehydrogenase
MRELEGKVALVTGSTSGIGLGIAKRLAQSGARVVMNGTSKPEDIEKTRAELAATYQTDVVYFGTDLTKPEAITDMMAQIKKQLGPVDILVNNAGIGKVASMEQLTRKDWDDTIAVNLSATFHTCQAAIPDMKEKGWGRIVNIGSVHSLVAASNKAAYTASKFGVLGLTKEIALETAENGITANVVCPGYVKTPMIEGRIKTESAKLGMTEDQWVKEVMLKEQPTKKFVTVEEIADTVAFLCSPSARSMTGHEVVLDGGWTAH